MRKTAFVVLTFLLIGGFNALKVSAIDGAKDATCANVDQYGFKNVGLKAPDEQTFTPNFDRFTQADFIWGGQLTGIDGINISLINSVGTVVGSGTISPTINGGPTTRSWTPANAIPVRKGVTYKLRVENPNNADLVWYSGMNTCYSGGNARQANADENFDFGFSTYGYDAVVATPTPAQTAAPADNNTAATTATAVSNTTLNSDASAGSGSALSSSTSSSIFEPTALQVSQIAVDNEPVLNLAWIASKTSSIDGYEIFRAEGESGTFKNTAKVTSKIVEFKDGEVEAGKIYKYQVRAYKGSLESKSSNIVSATVEAVMVALAETTTDTETPTEVPLSTVEKSNLIYYFFGVILILLIVGFILKKLKKWPFRRPNDQIV